MSVKLCNQLNVYILLSWFDQLHTTGEGNNQIHTVQSVDSNGHNENMTVDLTEATLGQDGQLIITGEDGHGKCTVYYQSQTKA